MQDLEELREVLKKSFALNYGDGLALSKDALLNLEIQLAIAERLDGILTEMKEMNKPQKVKIDLSKTPTA